MRRSARGLELAEEGIAAGRADPTRHRIRESHVERENQNSGDREGEGGDGVGSDNARAQRSEQSAVGTGAKEGDTQRGSHATQAETGAVQRDERTNKQKPEGSRKGQRGETGENELCERQSSRIHCFYKYH